MRLACLLSALTASAALVAAPVALAQSTEKAQTKPATSAAKPAAKAATSSTKAAAKVEPAAARTTTDDLKKSSDKSYDGCGYGKVTAAADL